MFGISFYPKMVYLKHVILEVILEDPSIENWSFLGNKLLETVIFENEYAWILIDGSYSSVKLLNWASIMSEEAENEKSSEIFFFKYLTYAQPHFIINGQVEKSVEWLSFSKTNRLSRA